MDIFYVTEFPSNSIAICCYVFSNIKIHKQHIFSIPDNIVPAENNPLKSARVLHRICGTIFLNRSEIVSM